MLEEVQAHELDSVAGGVAPVIVGAWYVARGAAAIYGIWSAGRYVGQQVYEK